MYGSLLASCIALGSFLVILRWVYDYFRDIKGLRRYPNMSFLSGISNIPFMLLSQKGFRSRRLYELHSRGIPVIRVGPNSLSYGDNQVIKDIYGHGSRCTKDDQYAMAVGTHFNVADVIDKKEHQRKRKLLASAYALKNLEEWEFKVADKVERLLAQLDRRINTVIDMKPWFNYFSLDAIADIGLSHRLGFLDQGDDITTAERLDGSVYRCHYRDSLHANQEISSILGYGYYWYHVYAKLSKFSPSWRALWKRGNRWDDIVLHLTAQRLRRYQNGEKLDDLFESILHDKSGSPHNLEFGEMAAEISIMMNAGSVTTGVALANVMLQLAQNPRCLETLRRELDNALDTDEQIAPYDKVKHLTYLRACLDESLRITPPVSHPLVRQTPPEGATIRGEFLPGGTTVSLSAYVAHRDPKMFPEPETYLPERWLGEAGKELGPYFVAFTTGPRGCIGRNISYLEQTVLVATMVHQFEFELADRDFVPQRFEHNACFLTDLPMVFRRRNCLAL